MIGILTRKQTVSIGREVDANNFGALVGNHIQETGILVSEAVVVLSPDDGCQENVERSNPDTPLDLETLFEPLAVLQTVLVTVIRDTAIVANSPG